MKETFAHRFKTARLVSGISQKELADSLSVTKQAVSKYEKGLMLPDSTALLKIADILNYKPDYFFRPLTVKLENVEFRKRSSLKGKKLAAVKAQVIDKLERYLELEELMNIINDFDNPISNITIRRINDVENACNQLLAAWKLGSNPLPNILEMVEDNGIKVIEMDTENSFDGLSTWIGKIPVIVVNKNTDIVRKRFNVLHELGHLLLQIPDDTTHKNKEAFCNRFAGAMLIPKKVFIDELGVKRSHVSINELVEIKEYYGISIAALVYRANELDIIPNSFCRRFWKRRNLDKNLKFEIGYGKYQGKESSGRFDQLLYKAIAEEVISLSKAAYLANTELKTISENLQYI